MADIARDRAVAKLAHDLPSLGADDLAEVHNELFPAEPATEDEARQERSRLLARITDHFRAGLEAEEVVALWHLVFPKSGPVFYDEEADTLCFRDEAEPVQHAE